MPLRDHFHPPLSQFTSWEGFHGGWPMVIVQQLDEKLPARFVAEPRVHLGSQVEVDIGALEHDNSRGDLIPSDKGGVATALWAPAEPTFAVETQLGDVDEYEVLVYDIHCRRRLVAAVEIISPGNKDRAESRNQFTAKCAALLRRGVSLILVDVVTARRFNLYRELLDLIDEHDPSLTDAPSPIYVATCRWVPRGAGYWLEVWNNALAIGSPLPCPPLWLSEDLAIPLDLEASYEKACRDLRIA